MNAYDILGLTPPIDSVVHNKKKRSNKTNKSIKGGDDSLKESVDQTNSTTESPKLSNKNITLQNLTNGAVVEEYEPKITRPTISKYEYAEIHTMLADYIEPHSSIKEFTDDVEIKGNVNPAELAFYLLKEHKWNATINRGYEIVSFSKLKINKQWSDTIENYFKEQHETQKRELFEPLGLI